MVAQSAVYGPSSFSVTLKLKFQTETETEGIRVQIPEPQTGPSKSGSLKGRKVDPKNWHSKNILIDSDVHKSLRQRQNKIEEEHNSITTWSIYSITERSFYCLCISIKDTSHAFV